MVDVSVNVKKPKMDPPFKPEDDEEEDAPEEEG